MNLRRFFLPSLTPRYLLRVAIVAALAYGIFGHVLLPMRVSGYSMEPTYHTNRLNFCVRLRYAFAPPRRGDVVVIRLAGTRVLYLKRVVALQGDTVEFRGGTLLVNGYAVNETYVKGPCDWDLPRRSVAAGCVYVVGDNRSVPIENAVFGETRLKRIAGAPLW